MGFCPTMTSILNTGRDLTRGVLSYICQFFTTDGSGTADPGVVKSNKMKICTNETRVNDGEMSTRKNNEAWSIPEISVPRFPIAYMRHMMRTWPNDMHGEYSGYPSRRAEYHVTTAAVTSVHRIKFSIHSPCGVVHPSRPPSRLDESVRRMEAIEPPRSRRLRKTDRHRVSRDPDERSSSPRGTRSNKGVGPDLTRRRPDESVSRDPSKGVHSACIVICKMNYK